MAAFAETGPTLLDAKAVLRANWCRFARFIDGPHTLH
jgi:hypothetical protein